MKLGSFLVLLMGIFVSPFALAETNEVDLALITDSDLDGAVDWEEWEAGTNAKNSDSVFAITDIQTISNQVVITWQGVNQQAYEIVSAATVKALATNPVHLAYVTANGGSPPWYTTTSSITNMLSSSAKYFQIRLVQNNNYGSATLDMATFE